VKLGRNLTCINKETYFTQIFPKKHPALLHPENLVKRKNAGVKTRKSKDSRESREAISQEPKNQS